ncbi:MAG: tryptophan synthase subunit alpha [Phycisphaerales bacterium]|nr:MAG: tryptophan synthase subunit alpha [Phycisphaerales bacterium]
MARHARQHHRRRPRRCAAEVHRRGPRGGREGLTRIDDAFTDVRAARAAGRAPSRGVLAPFVVAGRPSLAALPDMLVAMERAGAGIVEIGIPFSDPIADGPVIAGAMHKALLDGVTPHTALEAIGAARDRVKMGLVAMVSVSIVQRLGAAAFCRECAAAGLDGVIFPDAPLEEAPRFTEPAREAGLDAVLLVAPSSPPERAAEIASMCSGFVYMLARAGLTGEREGAPDAAALRERVHAARAASGLPVACGFGISRPEHVRAILRQADADAAIVGSALVRRIEDGIGRGEDGAHAASAFVAELAAGLD